MRIFQTLFIVFALLAGSVMGVLLSGENAGSLMNQFADPAEVDSATASVSRNPFVTSSSKKDTPKNGWDRKRQLETPKRMSDLQRAPNVTKNWPPKVGKRFPKVELYDHNGNSFSFSDLPDRPTVIELIAMSCAGCQAFAGANEVGAYGGFASQQNLKSFDEYFRNGTGQDLHRANVNFVQIVFYDLSLESPSPAELSAWRKHFKLDRHKNTHVISGGEALANQVSFKMIPGFMLLDGKGIVRYDACGHQPRHNVYTELLPAVRKMLQK